MNYEQDARSRTKLSKIFIYISVLGIIITVIGCFLSFKYIYLDVKNNNKVNGSVISHSNHNIIVKYNVNQKVYRKKLFSFKKNYVNNEKIKLYYDPSNPDNVKISSNRYYTLIIPGIGILIQGICGIGLIFVYMKYYGKYRSISL